MRIKSLWLWLALLVSSFALVAGGCGGDEEGAGTGATTAEGGSEAAEQVITVNWGTEPPSLDPGLASDTTSANILLNIMDPLVELDEDLNPVPAAAESFETSEDGKTVTFVLRDDLKWTNGDPVIAGDFEYAWKRTVSPELGADYAYQFYGIVGAQEYNSCDAKKDDCAALADKMGVKAVDDKTLEVTLTSPQPWFTCSRRRTTRSSPCNKKAVDKFGDKWTEAANIVTNGPFKLESWEHNSVDRPRQGRQLARRRQRQAHARQRASDQRSDHRGAGVRGRRGRRALPGAAALRGLAAEGDAGVRAVPGARQLLLRVQRREHPRRQAAPCDVAGDSAPVDHRQRRAGRPAARRRVHARGHAGLRRDQPRVSVAAGRARRRAGEAADERGRQPEDERSRCTRTTRVRTRTSPSRSRPR